MNKKKRKIKNRRKIRRHISSEQMFPAKMDEQLMLMDYSIRRAIPDYEERQKYIEGLITAFDKDIEEKTCKITHT